ncbi:nickel/cobalt ABC transporter permease [Paenibacillus xanthanilyticus]|uniref:Nickel/cobalt ABC transporter permease n=1 Tax=Paenibacillus xanthanilyticus TaxID=1783531 RepID=A0ABV8JYM3_9BACL
MGAYLIRRLLIAMPMLAVSSFLTFLLIHLSPMDPAEVVLHAQGVPVPTEDLIAHTREELGLNDPLLLRYARWAADCMRLDFGYSYVTGEPVWSQVGPAFLHTLQLTLISSAAIIGASILLGVACAMRAGTLLDQSARGISFVLTAMPSYWLASLLIWLLAVKLDLLPTSGMDSGASYILPVTVMTLGYAGIYFRSVRASMLGQLHEGYVLYGRASGLAEAAVTRHIVRNSLQVAITVFGMAVPTILGSTVVIENVFAWPGLGRLGVKAILSRDFPIIQAYVFIVAVSFVLFNTLADLIQAALNPRFRKEL